MKVLVVEDNEILSRNIIKYLISRDIHSDLANTWTLWLEKAVKNYYDIIILDINLPGINWLEICKKLREKWKDAYIIMLTSMWWDEDIVNWLNYWADDYLVKPFQYNVLLARMNAVMRRKLTNKSNTLLTINDIELDLVKMEIRKSWEIVKISGLEFDLFKYLLQNKWKALSRKEIYEVVWWESWGDFLFSKTIDVYVWYLRKKFWWDIIETKKGFWFLIR